MKFFSTCLAGSMRRGKDEQEDVCLGEELLHDQKNLQEHQYVVSMISNALESVCEKVMVPAGPTLMKKPSYPAFVHTGSRYIQGRCHDF
ncbi:chorismate-binding protein [Peribacillus frigoritolerans]|nr:chorismate-binding protein [Peribacillus frigoritolerans]